MDSKSLREQTVREAKCALILDASLKVFGEKGFHETRLEDIAAAAGFSKGSLYNYFQDKEDIFLTLAVREHEHLLDKLREVPVSDAPLHKALHELLETIFIHFGRHFAFFIASVNLRTASAEMLASMHKHHGKAFARFRELTLEMIRLVSMLFAGARERGEFSSDTPDQVLASYVAHLIRGTFLEWKISGTMGDVETEIDRILDFTLRGIHANT